jgi:hypothetical protein
MNNIDLKAVATEATKIINSFGINSTVLSSDNNYLHICTGMLGICMWIRRSEWYVEVRGGDGIVRTAVEAVTLGRELTALGAAAMYLETLISKP